MFLIRNLCRSLRLQQTLREIVLGDVHFLSGHLCNLSCWNLDPQSLGEKNPEIWSVEIRGNNQNAKDKTADKIQQN